jgi:diaminopimelate epimerase
MISKGHGTENDFVIIDDLAGAVDLTDDLVRALCDRRSGIGADGVLRLIATDRLPDAPASAAGTSFFMDYRNADGSVAEMCGNGLRVFVRYLAETGRLAGPANVIGTRAGGLATCLADDDRISVDLGVPERLDAAPSVHVAPLSEPIIARTVLMPNPHAVVDLGAATDLDSLDLTRPPILDTPLPAGQNVEFVVTRAEHHLAMRVHERGVGETRSCGTGIGAVVAVRSEPGDRDWRVDVPGGTCSVVWQPDGHLWLTGPAVIVARLELDPAWLQSVTPSASTS